MVRASDPSTGGLKQEDLELEVSLVGGERRREERERG